MGHRIHLDAKVLRDQEPATILSTTYMSSQIVRQSDYIDITYSDGTVFILKNRTGVVGWVYDIEIEPEVWDAIEKSLVALSQLN